MSILYASHRPKSRFFGILAKINFARSFKDRLHFLEEIIGWSEKLVLLEIVLVGQHSTINQIVEFLYSLASSIMTLNHNIIHIEEMYNLIDSWIWKLLCSCTRVNSRRLNEVGNISRRNRSSLLCRCRIVYWTKIVDDCISMSAGITELSDTIKTLQVNRWDPSCFCWVYSTNSLRSPNDPSSTKAQIGISSE